MVPYRNDYLQSVIVTDGKIWRFGMVDLTKKKVYFSGDWHLNGDTNLVDLIALITIWTGKPVSHICIMPHSIIHDPYSLNLPRAKTRVIT